MRWPEYTREDSRVHTYIMRPRPCFLCRAVLGWEQDGCATAGAHVGRRIELLARTGIAWGDRGE